jgi:hypothetical protein
MLDRARTDQDSELVYFDGCRLTSFVGHHHLLAGQPRLAEPCLRTSLAHLKPQQIRHIALTRLDLAAVLIAQGELAEGCDQAMAALSIPSEQLIDSVVRRARQLQARLSPHQSRFTPAHDLIGLIDSL